MNILNTILLTGGVGKDQGPEQMVQQGPPPEPTTFEFLGMIIDKSDFFTAVAIAVVGGAIALAWWIIRRRIQRKFPLPSEKKK